LTLRGDFLFVDLIVHRSSDRLWRILVLFCSCAEQEKGRVGIHAQAITKLVPARVDTISRTARTARHVLPEVLSSRAFWPPPTTQPRPAPLCGTRRQSSIPRWHCVAFALWVSGSAFAPRRGHVVQRRARRSLLPSAPPAAPYYLTVSADNW